MLQGAAFCELTTRIGLCHLLNGQLTHFSLRFLLLFVINVIDKRPTWKCPTFKFVLLLLLYICPLLDKLNLFNVNF